MVNARLAKLMIGSVNKSDKLDAKGMNRLQRMGTLPTVWIAPSSVRDARELPRTRMVLSRQRTQFKNRIHATLGKYGLQGGRRQRRLWQEGPTDHRESFAPSCHHTPNKRLRLILDELDHVQENLKDH